MGRGKELGLHAELGVLMLSTGRAQPPMAILLSSAYIPGKGSSVVAYARLPRSSAFTMRGGSSASPCARPSSMLGGVELHAWSCLSSAGSILDHHGPELGDGGRSLRSRARRGELPA
ncbi:hypothetical protein Dimus_003493 [Dionaea muscipula]